MELNLMRLDFAQVGTTNRSCMRVIPSQKSNKSKEKRPLEKIVVGSHNGCVICLCRKNNDTQIIYKSPPGLPIEAVCLGGAIGTLQDKYVICPDDILDIVCLMSTGGAWSGRPFTSVAACADAVIRVIEGSKIAYEVQLSSVPNTLYLFMGDGGFSKQLVLYGTKNGQLGLIDLGAKGADIKWEISTSTLSGITAITCYPFTGSDHPNILIGKADGMLEIYTVDSEDHCVLYGIYHCDESITSIGCGRISSEEEDEIVVCTYTGWLFSLAPSKYSVAPTSAKTADVHVKVQQLRTDIKELETKLNEERVRYGELTKKGGNQAAYIPMFEIHDSFEFSPQYNAYALTIELAIQIDFIIVQSKIPARLIEVERNASVVCQQAQSEYNPWALLASYRCQANVNRIELRVKVDEGIHGPLVIYICPKSHPKTVQNPSSTVDDGDDFTKTHKES
ncbi:hypothetical protein DICVIV_08399 [Dictyocaulus viviparus]|uniref:Bardet-Biedl syndrome 7 protein n=1 Tax=Dictyocaulus viviparus TaxID=29172 RepID=A0A0D8XP81_DICVI|nr:hypothetical protein DICVIV_08399 [Dictyocaulus viviparus]